MFENYVRRLQFESSYFVETLEWTYFAKAFGKELFRKLDRKGLISRKRLEGPYSKIKFSKTFVPTCISARRVRTSHLGSTRKNVPSRALCAWILS